MRPAGYTKTEQHSSFSGLKKAARLENVLSLATVVASLIRVRARACVVLACVAAMLCAVGVASAHPSVQPKTRIWDFSSASPLNVWLERSASPRTHPENQSGSAKLASVSPHAGGGTGAGKTVLGKFPHYVNLADDLGASRFSVPTKIWNKMTPAEQWAANQKFLDRMIARGDEIILSNPVRDVSEATGWFGRELSYLVEQGFRLSADGTRMIR